jgi:AraC family transcriptional regulator
VKSTRKISKVVERKGKLPPRLLRLVTDYLESHLDQKLTVRRVADLANMSPYHFGRLFKESTGLTPHQYLVELRVLKAKQLLQSGSLTLGEISSRLGFSSRAHFTTVFRKRAGTTPKEFRLKQSR